VTSALLHVQKSLEPLYRRYFTEKGRSSSSSPVLELEKEIRALEVTKNELREKIETVDDKNRQLGDLQQQVPGIEARVKESRTQLEKTRTEASDFSTVESELRACQVEVSNAERDQSDAWQALEELRKSSETIVQLEAKEMLTRQDHSKKEAQCELLEKRQHEVKEEVEGKAMQVRESEDLIRDARILWTKFDTGEKLKTMTKTVERIKVIDTEIETMEEQTLTIVPTGKELETLKQCQTKIEVLTQSLGAGGLVVGITPGKRGVLVVEVDGQKIEKGTLNAVGAETVTVGASGFGRATVTANLKQMRDTKTEIARLQNAIKSEMSKYGTTSVAQLAEVFQTQDKIACKVKELHAVRKGIDERSLSELELDLKKLREKSDSYASIERTSTAVNSNPTDIDLGELIKKREKEETGAREALDKVRQERDKLDARLSEEKQTLAELRTNQTHVSDELRSARTRERENIGIYGTIGHQEGKLAAAAASLEKKEEECEHTKQRYEDLLKGPVNKIKRLEREVSNGEALVQQQLSTINQLLGAIKEVSLDGTYSDLTQTDSRIEILDERLRSERISSEACGLLKETLDHQYHSTLLAVVGPIKHEVERFLRYVTGDLHEDVDLNEYLFPTSVSERGLDGISLEFIDSSSGLREVLALCVRLAIAEHLSKSEPQCLALDDPFVHVSSDRSNRIVELINKAIEECGLQVIIFTHRASEFAGFNGKLLDVHTLAVRN